MHVIGIHASFCKFKRTSEYLCSFKLRIVAGERLELPGPLGIHPQGDQIFKQVKITCLINVGHNACHICTISPLTGGNNGVWNSISEVSIKFYFRRGVITPLNVTHSFGSVSNGKLNIFVIDPFVTSQVRMFNSEGFHLLHFLLVCLSFYLRIFES